MSDNHKYDALKLENQLCFPLYVCAKEIVRRYHPFLTKLDLTYTQYIAMMVMWEHKALSVKALGELVYLDSGTLTPLLKKLEQKEYITRARDKFDERTVIITVTDKGMALRDEAVSIPKDMCCCLKLNKDKALELAGILKDFIKDMSPTE